MKNRKKSTFWEKRSEDFEMQVFLVTDAVRATLDHADIVVRALNKSEADFIVHFAAITASLIFAVFRGPSQAKNISRSSSRRPSPPNQMGRLHSKLLTTIR